MAVSILIPYSSSPSMWHLKQPHTAFSAGYEGTTDNALYYNTTPLEPTSVIPMYEHTTNSDQSPVIPGESPVESPVEYKYHGSTSSAKVSKMKRSTSTPNVRSHADNDAANMAIAADKRRNKLGYHRTSVACGHCRRRKIRCILAPGDPQRRCSNCIRLKKECKFYPVDQQEPIETKRRSSRSHGFETGDVSASSSPSILSSKMSDAPTNTAGLQGTLPVIQDLGGPQMKKIRTESLSPERKDTITRTYEYGPSQQQWPSSEVSPNSKDPFVEPQTYWRSSNESPLTPAFSPFTPTTNTIPPHSEWSAGHPDLTGRGDFSWSAPPPRSLSYNNLDKLNEPRLGSFSQPADAGTLQAMQPRAVQSMYPPSTTAAASVQSSQIYGTVPGYPAWQPQYPPQAPVASNVYGNWNQPHPVGVPVPAESSHTMHHHYGYGEQQPGSFYAGQGHER